MEEKKKNREKKKFKTWEKIFVFISSLMVIITFFVYMGRLVYFYKEEHPDTFDNRLSTHIKKEGVVYSGDGLYTFDEKEYYFYGKNVKNYIWFSGNLWRIIDITDSGMKIISDKNITSLVWGIESDYNSSYINKWINDNMTFLDNKLLVNTTFCIGNTSVKDVKCDYKDGYYGLLSINEYLRAGGNLGYLNNGEYYWLSNTSLDGNAYYVHSTGGINDQVSSNETYYSYGVRPVIVISDTINYYGGDGTIDNPYIVNSESELNVGSKSIGEYVSFSNYKWRIYDKEEGYAKLILDGYVNDNKYNLDKAISYLNKDFYNKLDKNKLVKCSFDNGIYGKSSKYNYENISSKKVNGYVGMPSISTFYINEYGDYWLYNGYDGNKELNYKMNSVNRIIADEESNKNYVRALICIKSDTSIKSGEGMKDSPYIVE